MGIGSGSFRSYDSAKSKIHSICRNYPVVKVRRAARARLPPATTEVEPSSSDPLVGGLPHMAEGHGSGARFRDMVPGDGLGEDGLRGWDPISSDVLCGAGARAVVETRRLELLTLSLQRRCSTS